MSCLFQSLAELLNARPDLHRRLSSAFPYEADAIRAEICAELERITVHDVPLAQWGAMESATDASAYIRAMRSDTEWGGAPEIAAFSKMVRVPIKVRGAARLTFGREFPGVAPLRLHYTGSHYTALHKR